MAITRLKRPQSLSELTLADLRKAIIDGSIELGEHLSEIRLSERLGVSKTPVREALQELRREGLVRIGPNSGTVVFLPNEAELHEIFDYRTLLELGAARRMFRGNFAVAASKMADVVGRMRDACSQEDHDSYRKLDSAFHHIIIQASGNPLIANAYAPLTAKIDALRNRGLKDISVVRRSLAFHGQLSSLLSAGAQQEFCDALEIHIGNSSRDYAAWLERLSAEAGEAPDR